MIVSVDLSTGEVLHLLLTTPRLSAVFGGDEGVFIEPIQGGNRGDEVVGVRVYRQEYKQEAE